MFDGFRNRDRHVNGVQHHGHRGYPAPGAGNTGCTMWEKARGARAPVMRLASERYDRAGGESRGFCGAATGTEPEGRSR